MGGAPIKREESSQRNEEDPTEQPTAGFDPTAGPDPKEKQEKNVLACTQVALALPNNTSSPAEATQVPNAVRSEGGQERHLHKRDGICRDKKSSESGVVDGAMVTGSDVGVSSALSKIKALAGMVRAQVSIGCWVYQDAVWGLFFFPLARKTRCSSYSRLSRGKSCNSFFTFFESVCRAVALIV